MADVADRCRQHIVFVEMRGIMKMRLKFLDVDDWISMVRERLCLAWLIVIKLMLWHFDVVSCSGELCWHWCDSIDILLTSRHSPSRRRMFWIDHAEWKRSVTSYSKAVVFVYSFTAETTFENLMIEMNQIQLSAFLFNISLLHDEALENHQLFRRISQIKQWVLLKR